MGLSNELVKAYVETDFVVLEPQEFVMKIGSPCQELLQLYQQEGYSEAAFITAWNPYSKTATQNENEAAQARLASFIDELGLNALDGVGRDPTGKWPGEPSFLVLGIPKNKAINLGRNFHQNAMVFIGLDGIPTLEICI